MASIKLKGDTSGELTIQAPSVAGTNTLNLPASSGTLATTAQASIGMKNRIINGNMTIDQRNAGASVTPVNAQNTIDRYGWQVSQAAKLTNQQSTVAPVGFNNSFSVTSSSAYSVLTGDYFVFGQRIEGFNTADLGWGTASASAVTLSFWVRSSLTGTFGGSVINGGFNRSYPFTYTISTANTWEQKSITIAGDTTGTWVGATNGVGMQIYWGLGVGSTYSGTAGSWTGSGLFSATGATSVVGTSGATFYITGVQLETGTTATDFEHLQYGQQLALCQRYYARLNAGTSAYTSFGSGSAYSTTAGQFYIKYPTTMRATPTFNGANLGFNDGTVSTAITANASSYLGTDSGTQQFGVASGLTQFRPYIVAGNNSTSAYIDLTAEL